MYVARHPRSAVLLTVFTSWKAAGLAIHPNIMRSCSTASSLRNIIGTSIAPSNTLKTVPARCYRLHYQCWRPCTSGTGFSGLEQYPSSAATVATRSLQPSRTQRCRCAVGQNRDAEPVTSTSPKLSDLPIQAIINPQVRLQGIIFHLLDPLGSRRDHPCARVLQQRHRAQSICLALLRTVTSFCTNRI